MWQKYSEIKRALNDHKIYFKDDKAYNDFIRRLLDILEI